MEAAFLRSVPEAQDVGRHHGYTPVDNLPVYATIRHPCDQVLSHWWKVKRFVSLENYVRVRAPRLNLHQEHIDRYFLYSSGLENIFTQLGWPGVAVEHIGGSKPTGLELRADQVDLINETFAEDLALYREALQIDQAHLIQEKIEAEAWRDIIPPEIYKDGQEKAPA